MNGVARLVEGMAKVTFVVARERNSYVGRPGSTTDLFLVRANGVPVFEVAPTNSYGMRPGKAYSGWLGIDGRAYGARPRLIPTCYETRIPAWWEAVTAAADEVIG